MRESPRLPVAAGLSVHRQQAAIKSAGRSYTHEKSSFSGIWRESAPAGRCGENTTLKIWQEGVR
jgi:hypothetical protein